MKKLLIALAFLFINCAAFCQTDSLVINNKNITVTKDSRIDQLNENYKSSYKLNGFRVQIYSDTKKQPARQIRAKFKNTYKEVEAYEDWQQPYYKVRVGDFKTKLEALKFQLEISDKFPNSFIVKDIIEYETVDSRQ